MSPYLCKNCGNKTAFYEEGDIAHTAYLYQNRFCDQDGATTDWGTTEEGGDGDYGEWESSERGIKCQECDEEAYAVSQAEWDAWEADKPEEEQHKLVPGKLNKLKERLLR